MKTEQRRAGDCAILVVPTVRGLLSEAREVAALVEQHAPDCFVLPVGPREHEEIVEVLKEKGRLPGTQGNKPAGSQVTHGPTGLPDEKMAGDTEGSDYEDFGLFLSTSDLLFLRQLARWGEVEMPAPSFQEIVRVGHERGIPVVAADFDDEGYTDVFLKHVTALSLVRQGRRLRKLAKKRFKVESAEAFALAWDGAVTKIPGYKAVEKARESQMAGSIRRAAVGRKMVMAVVELERAAGVLESLDAGLRAEAAAGGARTAHGVAVAPAGPVGGAP